MNYNIEKWENSRIFIDEINKKEKEYVCIFEDRNLIGCMNYGEIIGTLNPSDGDPWDICILGSKRKYSKGKKYKIERIIGELVLPNGNNKLIGILEQKKICNKRFVHDILVYKSIYEFMKGWVRGSIKISWFKN